MNSPGQSTSSTSNVRDPNLIPLLTMVSPQTAMNRKRILIVDDNMFIRRSLSMKLKSSGYDILEAADGGTAVSVARKERPDLILLDIGFPPDVAHGGGVAWDGFLIMAWIRRMEEAKHIPIIIITGSKAEDYKDRSFAAGASGFFQKPIDNDQLLASIRTILGEPQETPPA